MNDPRIFKHYQVVITVTDQLIPLVWNIGGNSVLFKKVLSYVKREKINKKHVSC